MDLMDQMDNMDNFTFLSPFGPPGPQNKQKNTTCVLRLTDTDKSPYDLLVCKCL